MKNNCQVLQKSAKAKTKIAPRKKKYSLKQRLIKAVTHAPILDNLQNKVIQQQTSNQFFQLFHNNFNIILTENSQHSDNSHFNKETMPLTSRTHYEKKNQNLHCKIKYKNRQGSKKTRNTQSRSKQGSGEMRKSNGMKSFKQTLRKTSCSSVRTISRSKRLCNSFLEIIPVIRI